MIAEKLAEVAQFAKAGEHDAARSVAQELVEAYPRDVRAQLAAAYACDRLGHEAEAMHHYRIASSLGVPEDERAKFLLGYASTLRNSGNPEEAIKFLKEACGAFPERAEFMAFLALAYHSSGQHSLALATMLRAGLMAAREDGFGVYGRALNEYHDELIASTITPQEP